MFLTIIRKVSNTLSEFMDGSYIMTTALIAFPLNKVDYILQLGY